MFDENGKNRLHPAFITSKIRGRQWSWRNGYMATYRLERVGEMLEDKGYNVIETEAEEVIAWFQYLSDADLFLAVLAEKERMEAEEGQSS
jgi:hypothetical protein